MLFLLLYKNKLNRNFSLNKVYVLYFKIYTIWYVVYIYSKLTSIDRVSDIFITFLHVGFILDLAINLTGFLFIKNNCVFKTKILSKINKYT